jgi:hypothetical protein
MPKRVTESKTTLVKKIVDIDYALASRKDLTPEERQELEKTRKRLERRLYH